MLDRQSFHPRGTVSPQTSFLVSSAPTLSLMKRLRAVLSLDSRVTSNS